MTNISERQPKWFLDDDIAPLMTGKIALVKVGDEMVLLGNTGGLERGNPTQARLPVFYAITVETAAGSVPTTPLVKWTNYGRCNESLNTSIPYCGVDPITNDWKIGYLSKGVNQVVAFMPSSKADMVHLRKRHALQIFSVATGEAKNLYTSANVPETGKMTDIDFAYEAHALAAYTTEKGIKEVYVGDTAGYIWRVSLSGLAFEDIQQITSPDFTSVPVFKANFQASFQGDVRPISAVRVSPNEGNRGGVASAPAGRMIVFATGNVGVRKLNVSIPNNAQHVIAAYFDPAVQGAAPPATYANLLRQIRKQDSTGKLVSENKDIHYSDVRLGWVMALTNPASGANEKEQIFASPYLFNQSVLVYTGVPVMSNFAMTNFVSGYFMQMNVQTGKIEEPAVGMVYTQHLSEGIFVPPTLIFNEKTGNTHFNIKYVSQEPYTESKVIANQAFKIKSSVCTPSVTTVCGSKSRTLKRLSVVEIFAS
jgi:Tfp pilus tip-associated adhesin PilY1